MQSLWSRAGQARHCGCRGCLQTAGGMIRQSTTRVARRKPTFGEVFTAFYTSIMGTAAMLDAKRKDERRKDLKRQIDEVKADIERLACTAMSETTFDPTMQTPPGNIHNRYKGVWRSKTFRPTNVAEFLDSLGDDSTWERIQPHSGAVKEWWKSSGLPQLDSDIARRKSIDYDALQYRLSLEEADDSISHRMSRNVIAQSKATKYFIQDMLDEVGLYDLRANANKVGMKLHDLAHNVLLPKRRASLEQELKDTESAVQDPEQRALRDLMARNRAIYTENSFPRGRDAWTRNSHSTYEAIRAVFGSNSGSIQDSEEALKRRVVQICHIIMSSPCPPNVHALSQLLLGFDRMGQHGLANAVIVQLVYRSRLEPTEQTIIAVLKHYQSIGNLERFNGTIRRCTMIDPSKTFKTRRKHVNELLNDKASMRWAKQNDVTAHGHYAYERVWFSNAIINTILDGLLSFDCIHQAVSVFDHCWRRGIRMATENLHQLVDQCIYAVDENAAFGVLSTVFRRPEYIWQNIDASQRQAFIKKLQHLVDICGINVSVAGSLLSRSSESDSAAMETRAARQQTFFALRVQRSLDLTRLIVDDTEAALNAYEADVGGPIEISGEELAVEQTAPKSVVSMPQPRVSGMIMETPKSPFMRTRHLVYGPFETPQTTSNIGRMSAMFSS